MWKPLDYRHTESFLSKPPFNGQPILTWTPNGIYRDVWMPSIPGAWGSRRNRSGVLFWMEGPIIGSENWIDGSELPEISIEGPPMSQTIIICHTRIGTSLELDWANAYFSAKKNRWMTNEGDEVMQGLVRGGILVPLKPAAQSKYDRITAEGLRGTPNPVWG